MKYLLLLALAVVGCNKASAASGAVPDMTWEQACNKMLPLILEDQGVVGWDPRAPLAFTKSERAKIVVHACFTTADKATFNERDPANQLYISCAEKHDTLPEFKACMGVSK